MLGGHVPPPAGVKSPALWGDQVWINETFGGAAKTIEVTPSTYTFRYRSPAHFVDVFRQYYGPMHKAFLALDETGQERLEADLLALMARFNRATNGTLALPSEYAQIIITKR
jgi:hypothetical protein